jgi:hypothetical protein
MPDDAPKSTPHAEETCLMAGDLDPRALLKKSHHAWKLE